MQRNIGASPLPYEIRVSPGWNLISVPRDPEETAIGGALAAAESLSTVMGYQNGDWLTARKTADGWEGDLTEFRGGYGYWVLARADETIPVALVRPDRLAPAPAVPVSYGWNLLGALDAERNAPGEPLSATDGGADRCFAGVDWEVAYSLERNSAKPDEVVWKRIVPGDDGSGAVLNGSAYWIWVNAPGALAARNEPSREAAAAALLAVRELLGLLRAARVRRGNGGLRDWALAAVGFCYITLPFAALGLTRLPLTTAWRAI